MVDFEMFKTETTYFTEVPDCFPLYYLVIELN